MNIGQGLRYCPAWVEELYGLLKILDISEIPASKPGPGTYEEGPELLAEQLAYIQALGRILELIKAKDPVLIVADLEKWSQAGAWAREELNQ